MVMVCDTPSYTNSDSIFNLSFGNEINNPLLFPSPTLLFSLNTFLTVVFSFTLFTMLLHQCVIHFICIISASVSSSESLPFCIFLLFFFFSFLFVCFSSFRLPVPLYPSLTALMTHVSSVFFFLCFSPFLFLFSSSFPSLLMSPPLCGISLPNFLHTVFSGMMLVSQPHRSAGASFQCEKIWRNWSGFPQALPHASTQSS